MVKLKVRHGILRWEFVVLPLALVLTTCDESTTGPDLADQPSSGPTFEEPYVNILVALTGTMHEVRSSQVSARDVLVLRPTVDPESRTVIPRETTDPGNVPGQSLPRTEVNPKVFETFEDLIAFIDGRPSLWMELENNVWLIVVYENEPAPTPAGVYVKVAA